MSEQASSVRVLAFAGSLRAGSLNRALLRAAVELAPPGLALEVFDLAEVPLYNGDLEAVGDPPAVAALKVAIAAADGVLIATPEYNFSLPPVLKNAIDWVSKMPNQPFNNKPVAVFSASTGPLGGARVQYDVRKILVQLWGLVLPRPEVFIGSAAGKFADGKLTDETTRKFLTELLAGFKDWIARMQKR